MQVQSYKSRVLFKGACSAIPEDALLLEIGPHAIMRSPLRQNCAGLPYVSTMKKGEDGTLTLREAVAGLWRKGAALKWDVPEDVPGQPSLHLPCCALLPSSGTVLRLCRVLAFAHLSGLPSKRDRLLPRLESVQGWPPWLGGDASAQRPHRKAGAPHSQAYKVS